MNSKTTFNFEIDRQKLKDLIKDYITQELEVINCYDPNSCDFEEEEEEIIRQVKLELTEYLG